MTIPGAVGASLVDHSTGVALAEIGASAGDDAVIGTAAVMATVTRQAPFASTLPDDPVEDVIVTTGHGYHLLRPVRTVFDSRLVLHLRVDRQAGNLAIARRRLQQLAEDIVEG